MRQLPFATEVLMGDIPLRIGHRMTFHYDFGDDWRFDVTLEQVDVAMTIHHSVLLESHSESLQQYLTAY